MHLVCTLLIVLEVFIDKGGLPKRGALWVSANLCELQNTPKAGPPLRDTRRSFLSRTDLCSVDFGREAPKSWVELLCILVLGWSFAPCFKRHPKIRNSQGNLETFPSDVCRRLLLTSFREVCKSGGFWKNLVGISDICSLSWCGKRKGGGVAGEVPPLVQTNWQRVALTRRAPDYSSNLCPPKIWSIWLFRGCFWRPFMQEKERKQAQNTP